MNRPDKYLKQLMRATLLVVLMAAQSLAVAHEFSHWEHSVQELCATCSLTSNLDDINTVDQPLAAIACAAALESERVHVQFASFVILGYTSRAPPISL